MTERSTQEASAAFEALSDRRRRVVCYYLRERERASLETLTDLVAGWLASGPGPDEPAAHEDVRVALHHVHLPKLAECGLVEYEADTGTARLRPLSPAVETVLEAGLEADTGTDGLDLAAVIAATGPKRTDTDSPAGETGGDGEEDDADSGMNRPTER